MYNVEAAAEEIMRQRWKETEGAYIPAAGSYVERGRVPVDECPHPCLHGTIKSGPVCCICEQFIED